MGRLAWFLVIAVCLAGFLVGRLACRAPVQGVSPEKPPPVPDSSPESAPVVSGPPPWLDDPAPELRPVDLDAVEVFPVRHRTSTTRMRHGQFAQSPDRTRRVVCVEVYTPEGVFADTQFWLHDPACRTEPPLLFSTQKTFHPFDPGYEVCLLQYGVIWSGDGQGVYVVATPEDCDNSLARVYYFALEGNGRELHGEAFRSQGKIVGALAGTEWLVTQTLAIREGRFHTRVSVVDPDGNTRRTFGDPQGPSTHFEDAGQDGRLLYCSPNISWDFVGAARLPTNVWLGDALTGETRVIGVGAYPRFRPKHGTVSFLTRYEDDFYPMEYDPATAVTRKLANCPKLWSIWDCAWSADGRTVFVLIEVAGRETGWFIRPAFAEAPTRGSAKERRGGGGVRERRPATAAGLPHRGRLGCRRPSVSTDSTA